MAKRFFGTGTSLFFAAALAAAAVAEEPRPRVQARLVPEVLSVQPGVPFWVAVRLRMDDGWHTYWKNPGDSGLGTQVQWRLPPGFEAGPLRWPYPERIETPPLVSFGYHGEAVFLAPITPPSSLKPGQTVEIAARVDWLECADVCVPGKADLSLRLPVTAEALPADPDTAQVFARARSRLPLEETGWTVDARQGGKDLRITLSPPAWVTEPVSGLEFFPETSGLLDTAARPVLRRSGGPYVLEFFDAVTATAPLADLRGVLVCEEGWRGPGSERALAVDAPVTPMESGRMGLGAALAFAFAGGLLLNLMPCVLPVLSLKVLGFVKQAGASSGQIRRQGLLFGAGVMVSFWTLAGLLEILRAAGKQAGWGFQLQSPVFVICLACLFFLLGLNMAGVFEVGASLTRAGGLLTGAGGAWGSFLGGVLATTVATPCTAPFMGAALGFALTQSTAASFGVFTALGAGMAFPYAALAHAPRLLSVLPRPGPWMDTFKQAMGFFLFGTVVWLLWVLGLQTNTEILTGALAGFLIMALGAWVWGRWTGPEKPGRTRVLAVLASASLILAGAAWALTGVLPKGEKTTEGAAISWETYSDQRLAELRHEGRPVFIDFTAAWCLTCQVNERVALSSPAVVRRFRELNVAALKADWTSQDDQITRALHGYGRNGVPLYVYYKAGEDRPRFLPEVITPQVVLKALE